jgi:hypothetical protein
MTADDQDQREQDQEHGELGPAMAALRPHWRKAVLGLFLHRGRRTKAYLEGFPNGNPEYAYSRASRFFGDKRVIAAVREVALKNLQIEEPELLGVVHDIIRDVTADNRDRLMAVRMVWDRTRPAESKLSIDVSHHLTVEQTEVQHYRALQRLGAPRQAFIERFGHNGIERVERLVAIEDKREAASKVVDASYEEVKNGD